MPVAFDIRDIQDCVTFANVSWEEYEETLDEIGERHIHAAFLDGIMEIMSPLADHEGTKKAIGDLITILCYEKGIVRKSFGSTTFRDKRKSAGSEPDECFYFNDINSVKGMKRFDPLLHRAPDLWIEVDVFNSSIRREVICARFGVPELWRYRNGALRVRVLTPTGEYADAPASKVFPFLPMPTFAEFIPKMIEDDETKVLREFRDWVERLPS